MKDNNKKQLSYSQFVTQYVNYNRDFKFTYKNLTLNFYHEGKTFILKLNDGLTNEKIIKLSTPILINKIKINNVFLCELWDYFTLI